MKSNNEILVTCVCITFNHKDFIRQCLDGMLMQETTFPYEIIVYDDCSTDGTREIVKEYAALHPDKIRTVLPEENQYSKLGDVVLENFVLPVAKGKYVALCEGDDYWNDAQKLQKQATWMEQHPDYSVTFHRCLRHDVDTDKFMQDDCARLIPTGEDGVTLNLAGFLGGWSTQPLSMVFRKVSFQPEKAAQYKHYRDMHQIYHLLENGPAYLFAWVGGVYNLHVGGVAGKTSTKSRCEVSLAIAQELYEHNHNMHTRNFYASVLQWAIYEAKKFGLDRFQLSLSLLMMNKDIIRFLKNICLKK